VFIKHIVPGIVVCSLRDKKMCVSDKKRLNRSCPKERPKGPDANDCSYEIPTYHKEQSNKEHYTTID